jgi:hypothetical protein
MHRIERRLVESKCLQRVYVIEPMAPTHWIPLTPRDVERKIAALLAYVSWLVSWGGVVYAPMRVASSCLDEHHCHYLVLCLYDL